MSPPGTDAPFGGENDAPGADATFGEATAFGDDAVLAEDALGEGDVVLVTGSTSGIGRETARNLAATGATVLVHGRDEERARETVATLPGDGHDWYRADFADLDAVRSLAGRVRDDHDRLDCLVNNAGTWQDERRLVDVPGAGDVELTFAVNHLAPFCLTHLLVDRLAATGTRREGEDGDGSDDGHEGDDDGASDPDGGSDDGGAADVDGATGADPGPDADGATGADPAPDPARVVTVSSGLHRRATMDLDAVRGPDGPTGQAAYALSKLANVLFTAELARRLPASVVANCCHPGVAPDTALARDGSLFPSLVWRLFGLVGGLVGFTDSPDAAAETPTFLANSPDVAELSGEYFQDCEPVPPGDGALDREAQRELWAASVEWTGVSADLLAASESDDRSESVPRE